MKIIFILGPTGTGKSDIAIDLATRIGAEIISCDSMMVYRGMDIGTAKPSSEDRLRVPHHLIDIREIKDSYSAKNFTDDASSAVTNLADQGKPAIVCGGTGFYAKALLSGYSFLPTSRKIARDVEKDFESGRERELLAELKAVDPESAERVKENPRRLVRAVQVIRITGQPVGYTNEELSHHIDIEQRILFFAADTLRTRIRRRTERMLDGGWLEETESLIDRGLETTPIARTALGYAAIISYLNGEIRSRSELADRIATQTAQYAKKQRTWFRHQHANAVFLNFEDHKNHREIADAVIDSLEL